MNIRVKTKMCCSVWHSDLQRHSEMSLKFPSFKIIQNYTPKVSDGFLINVILFKTIDRELFALVVSQSKKYHYDS